MKKRIEGFSFLTSEYWFIGYIRNSLSHARWFLVLVILSIAPLSISEACPYPKDDAKRPSPGPGFCNVIINGNGEWCGPNEITDFNARVFKITSLNGDLPKKTFVKKGNYSGGGCTFWNFDGEYGGCWYEGPTFKKTECTACREDQISTPNGCACPAGTEEIEGQCLPECEIGDIRNDKGECISPPSEICPTGDCLADLCPNGNLLCHDGDLEDILYPQGKPEPNPWECEKDESSVSSQPVSAKGAKRFEEACLTLRYKTSSISVGLSYDSRWADINTQRALATLGKGWTRSHTQMLGIANAPAKLTYVAASGVEYNFLPNLAKTEWRAEGLEDDEATMVITQDGKKWLVTYNSGLTELFYPDGLLAEACSENADVCRQYEYKHQKIGDKQYIINTIHLTDKGSSTPKQTMELLILLGENGKRLVSVRDATSGLPSEIKREITFDYNKDGMLESITRPDGAKTSYEYDSAGYITARINPSMQTNSGDLSAGWRHEVVYEDTEQETYPKRRVKEQKWVDDNGNVQFKKVFNWDDTSTTIETWDYSTSSPTKVLTEKTDIDEKGRAVKVYNPNTTAFYTQYIYCDVANEPAHCPSDQSAENVRRVIAPNGSSTEYSYDKQGNLTRTTLNPAGATQAPTPVPVIDTDGDGISDLDEVSLYGTNPSANDSDGDGLSDGDEINVHNTDPTVADSDGDGLSDGDEINIHGTDPLNNDTDGDGMSDGDEVASGGNPLVDINAILMIILDWRR